jgi:hypothetical protein
VMLPSYSRLASVTRARWILLFSMLLKAFAPPVPV